MLWVHWTEAWDRVHVGAVSKTAARWCLSCARGSRFGVRRFGYGVWKGIMGRQVKRGSLVGGRERVGWDGDGRTGSGGEIPFARSCDYVK